jgi:hypothetical protein
MKKKTSKNKPAQTRTKKNTRTKEEKLDLLLALYITAIVVSELMGAKTFPFFFMNASVAIFTLPLTFSINDIVIEVAGKKRALNFMKSASAVLVFLALFNLLAIALPSSSRFMPFEAAYDTIFAKSLRMTIASLLAFFLAERLDIWVFSKIREKLPEKLWLKSNLSNFISQFFDTSIFMFLAFFNGDNAKFVWSLILPYWGLKMLFSVIETPFTYMGVNWIKKS